MNELAWSGLMWCGQTLLVGVLVLGLGRVALFLASGPATRERIATWSIRIAVLAPLLTLAPAWWTLQLPQLQEPPAQRSLPPEILAEPIFDDQPSLEPDGLAGLFPLVPNANVVIDETAVVAPPPVSVPLPKFEPAPPVTLQPEPSAPVTHWTMELLLIVVTLYGLIALYFLGEFSLGHWGLARLRRRSRPSPTRVQTILDEVVGGGGPSVLTHDTLPSPVCFGLTQPTIVLPQSLAQRGAAQELKWVLAHEADHLQRGDQVTSCLAGLARAFYFFCPWYWGVRRELSLAQEQLADAAAVEAGGQPFEYAEFLISLSSGTTVPTRRRALPALGVRAGRSQLFRRINMVLAMTPGTIRATSRRWGFVSAVGLFAVAMLASGWTIAFADDEKSNVRVEVRRVEAAGEDGKPQVIVIEKDITPPGAENKVIVLAQKKPDVEALKAKIAAAVKAGKADEAMKLMDELEKAMSPKVMQWQGALPIPPQPPIKPTTAPKPPLPPQAGAKALFFPGEAMDLDRLNATIIESLTQELQTAESAEAKAALAKAIEALKKRSAIPQPAVAPPLPQYYGDRYRTYTDRWNPEGIANVMVATRAPLGIVVQPVSSVLADQLQLPEGTGLVVMTVIPNSIAAKAGLKKNEIITKVGSVTIKSEKDLLTETAKVPAGEKMTLTVLRKGEETKLTVEKPKLMGSPSSTSSSSSSPKVRFEQMQVQVNNDQFEISATQEGTNYAITGLLTDGKPVQLKIQVVSGDKKVIATSVEKLPPAYQPAVKSLLSNVSGN